MSKLFFCQCIPLCWADILFLCASIIEFHILISVASKEDIMADERVMFAKLNGQNYDVWRFKMEMFLSDKDLWEAITTVRPTDTGSAQTTWEKHDRSARAKIALCVEDSQLIHIKQAVTAKGMWDALQTVYERKHLNTKLFLQRKLYSLKYNELTHMRDFIYEVMTLIDQLWGIGKPIPDDDVIALLLCSVPESYDSLITSLEGRHEDDLSLEYVKSKLIATYERRQESARTDEMQTAMKTTFKPDSTKSKRACYYCGIPGHVMRFCFKLKNDQQKKQQPENVHKITSTEETVAHAKAIYQCFKVNATSDASAWYIDSGASTHLANNKQFFIMNPVKKGGQVKVASGELLDIHGIGDGIIQSRTSDGETRKICIRDVLYVPKLDCNLLSVKRLDQSGFNVNFQGGRCFIKMNNELVAEGHLKDELYQLVTTSVVANQVTSKLRSCTECIHVWHRRFGHRDPRAIQQLHTKGLVKGLDLRDCGRKIKCVCCLREKLSDQPYPRKSEYRAGQAGDMFHADLCGPMQTQTPTGKRYMLTVIDDKSRFLTVFLLAHKSEAVSKIISFVQQIKTQFGRTPKIMRTDQGGEFINADLRRFFNQEGIIHQTSVPYCPQQNGVAERRNRYLVEMGRCMLNDAGLDRSYWGAAIVTAAYVQNCLPTRACDVTPYELWYGRKANVSDFYIFGCRVIYYIPNQHRRKWDSHGKDGIFIGYAPHSKGYLILDAATNRVITTRNMTPVIEENVKVFEEVSITEPTHAEVPCDLSTPDSVEMDELHQPQLIIANEGPRRSARYNKGIPPERYICAYRTVIEDFVEPTTWDDIEQLPTDQQRKWIAAADEEMQSMKEKDVWELTDLPKDRKPIDVKWVFKLKHNEVGDVCRHKARLVARGFTQKPGEDYKETFAPVANSATFRILLTVAAYKGLKVKHLDVKTAFLNGELKEELYVNQPSGYVVSGREDQVYRLKKGLYGLKQAAKAWNDTINDVLIRAGCERSKIDQCLYMKVENEQWTYLLLYVDDIIICVPNLESEEAILQTLTEAFDITDLGLVTYYLGVQVSRAEDGHFEINQSMKIKELIRRLGLEESKEAFVPMHPEYLKDENVSPELPHNMCYQEIVGILLYLATISRPDVATAVGILSRKVSQLTEKDWTVVKQVVRYLKKTVNMSIRLQADQMKMTIYVDADWAGDVEDRKSTSGYIVLFDTSPIMWASRKQVSVSLSSTEAEFIAASEAFKEGLWLLQLLGDMHLKIQTPIIVHEDNQGCIAMIKNERVSQRSKHIDVRYSFVRDLYRDGLFELQYCETKCMLGDLFTKPLSRVRFQYLCEELKLIEHAA